MSAATQAYNQATKKPVTTHTREFIDDLLEHFDDGRLAAAIWAEAERGDHGKILTRVRQRLATEDVHARQREQPQVHLEGAALMAVVRGQEPEPMPPYTFDARALTALEYTELQNWRSKLIEAGA